MLSGLRLNYCVSAILIIAFFLTLISILAVSAQEAQMRSAQATQSRFIKQDKLTQLEAGFRVEPTYDHTFQVWGTDSSPLSLVSSHFLYTEPKLLDSETKCLPSGFGYTIEEANLLFNPETVYPVCDKETPISIKIENSFLVKTCENMQFALGKPPAEEVFGRFPYYFEWKNMTSEKIDTQEREYAFIKCGEKREAAVFLKRQPEAAKRAKEITAQHKVNFNMQQPPRPLTVFMLIFDSLSRKHMYRNFPMTMKYLNETIGKGKQSGHFAMYDFVLNNGHGENTLPNMVPYLFGYSFKYHKQRLGSKSHLNKEDSEFFVEIQRDSIWKQFEKMGFITLFGFDIIWDFLTPAVGRYVKTDHVFTNFWKGASKVFGTDNYINEQCCFGSHDSHRYMLQYAAEYLEEYKGINRFGYIHVTTAHEKSGTIIKTVDDDLKEFMQRVLTGYAKSKEDVVFIMAGDHGKHVSETDIPKPGWQENMLPGQVVIANKDLMSRLRADQVFRTNTQRLVSRPDWHLTLKHLSLVPYGNLAKQSSVYNHWKKITDSEFSVSLLLETVPGQRTCKDVEIEDFACICGPYEELNLSEKNEYVDQIVKFSFDSVVNVKKNKLCRDLNFNKVLYAAVRVLEEGYKLYRLRVSVHENTQVVIEIYASVFWAAQEEKYKKPDFGGMPTRLVSGHLRGEEMIQLLKNVRIDEYGGYMEEFSVAIREKPTFCIPYMPQQIDEEMLKDADLDKALEVLGKDLVVRLAEKGVSCFEECRKFDQVCQPWGIQMLSNEGVFMRSWDSKFERWVLDGKKKVKIDKKKFKGKNGEFLGVVNQTVVYAKSQFGCHKKVEGVQLICPCKE